jgi:hypothetical protein
MDIPEAKKPRRIAINAASARKPALTDRSTKNSIAFGVAGVHRIPQSAKPDVGSAMKRRRPHLTFGS